MNNQQDPVEVFRQEAAELLESLEQGLLDMEQQPDNHDLIDQVFRSLHTLKGSGAMFGFDEMAGFVHEFETAFDRVRKGLAPSSPALVEVALLAKDHVALLIDEPGNHQVEDEAILARLRSVVFNGGVSEAASGQPPEPHEVVPDDTQALRRWKLHVGLPPDALELGTKPLALLDELRELGDCRVRLIGDRVPPLETLDPLSCFLAWEVDLTTDQPREAIEDVFIFLRDDMELTIEPMDGAADGPPSSAEEKDQKVRDEGSMPPSEAFEAAGQTGGGTPSTPATEEGAVSRDKAKAAPHSEKANTSLRVSAERLDELMDRVGELVIAQARLSQIAGASSDTALKAVAEEIERLSSGLRDTTMGIRMVQIGTLFGRFRRLVHDTSQELGKDIAFQTSGEETELDKTVIERLADPLVHIIRNAVDHGLEAPEARVAAGKPRRGQVRLTARHAGAEVAIAISDDGAGLDVERIRAKAVEGGLLSPDAKPTDQELFQYIFHPGFSTSKEVTSFSGRGVGMDVVKKTIDSLRGNIDVASVAGEGTTVTLRLPLTLAIIEGMLVRVGQGRYSIPLSAVEECVELSATAQEDRKGRNFLNIRGNLVPFLRLRELFKTQAPADLHQKAVIVSSGEHRVGLVVDQILGNNQTVIKSLSALHSDVETFSGATILGDGTVALILDVTHLVRFGQNFEDRLREGRAA